MTATLHRLGAGSEAGLYYTNDAQRETRPRNRDEYYTRDGGGVWWSTGQTVVQHDAAVEASTFRDLCAGVDPRTGQSLVRGAGEGHWAGVDLTFTAGKSVSVLWMAGTQEQRTTIEAAHRAAVDRALRFVVEEGLVLVRHGAGGAQKDRPNDLIVARFDHYTTREGDGNLHTHNVIMSAAGAAGTSGRYASRHLCIEPDRLFKWQLGVGAAYRAALAEELSKLGFTFRPAGQGQWEIAGIPEQVIETFSKRSHQIEKLVGRDASASQRQIAALATRGSKESVPTGTELEARWKQELEDLAVDPWHFALDPQRSPAIDRHEQMDRVEFEQPEIAGSTPVAVAASALFRHDSVIDRRQLLERALVAASLRGHGPDSVYEELAQLEAVGTLIALDGEHWTTSGIAAAEAEMLRAADREEGIWFDPEAVDRTLVDANTLSDEQRHAVLSVTDGQGITILEAGAGTGKTTTARSVVEAAHQAGLRVIGLAPSWTAADELTRSTGIEAQAVARWRWDQAHNGRNGLTAKDVLIIDEAGMLGTRDLSFVLSQAKAAGAKVILVGDRRQLESVVGGSALAAVRDVLQRTTTLTEVRRQDVGWQRAASTLMARGDSEAGLRTYSRYGHVELVGGDAAAQARTIDLWREARVRHGDDVLIVTRRNVDASALNRAARAVLRAEGRIVGVDIALPSIGRDDRAATIAIAAGDKLRFGETLAQLGIVNGTRAKVVTVEANGTAGSRLRLELDTGRMLEANWSDLARQLRGREQGLPRIVHGYAGTAYAAQGRTAEASILYLARQTDAREIYVGLTRHRQDVRVVVDSSRLDAVVRQRQEDHRVPPTLNAMLEQLYSEARRYREKSNIVDFVSDRVEFVASGKLRLPHSRPLPDIARSLQAARELREAARSLQPHQALVPVWQLAHGLNRARELPAAIRTLLATLKRSVARPRTPRHDYDLER